MRSENLFEKRKKQPESDAYGPIHGHGNTARVKEPEYYSVGGGFLEGLGLVTTFLGTGYESRQNRRLKNRVSIDLFTART